MLILLWTRRWEITQGSLYHPTCGPPAVAYAGSGGAVPPNGAVGGWLRGRPGCGGG